MSERTHPLSNDTPHPRIAEGIDSFPSPSDYCIPSPEQLRTLGERAGFSLRELASRTGFDKDTVRRWEVGETSPRLADARVLLEFYQQEAEGGE